MNDDRPSAFSPEAMAALYVSLQRQSHQKPAEMVIGAGSMRAYGLDPDDYFSTPSDLLVVRPPETSRLAGATARELDAFDEIAENLRLAFHREVIGNKLRRRARMRRRAKP